MISIESVFFAIRNAILSPSKLGGVCYLALRHSLFASRHFGKVKFPYAYMPIRKSDFS